jgi:hypothetical protein
MKKQKTRGKKPTAQMMTVSFGLVLHLKWEICSHLAALAVVGVGMGTSVVF